MIASHFKLLHKQKVLKWNIIPFWCNCSRKCCWKYNKLFLLCSS